MSREAETRVMELEAKATTEKKADATEDSSLEVLRRTMAQLTP